MELFANVNESEQRVEARIFVASYLAVDDTTIGLVEQEIEGMEWESDEAKQDAYDTHESDYDADEIYEALTGERVPACCGAEFYKGDLFLYMYADCDPSDPDSVREAFDELQ